MQCSCGKSVRTRATHKWHMPSLKPRLLLCPSQRERMPPHWGTPPQDKIQNSSGEKCRFLSLVVVERVLMLITAKNVGRPPMHHQNVPLKNAPSKRTLLTSFQRSLAEPPQQAAAAPTTHTRSNEEWDSRTSEKRSKEYVLMVHFLVVRFDGASGACQKRHPHAGPSPEHQIASGDQEKCPMDWDPVDLLQTSGQEWAKDGPTGQMREKWPKSGAMVRKLIFVSHFSHLLVIFLHVPSEAKIRFRPVFLHVGPPARNGLCTRSTKIALIWRMDVSLLATGGSVWMQRKSMKQSQVDGQNWIWATEDRIQIESGILSRLAESTYWHCIVKLVDC